jgi:hypothetical protein
MSLRNSINLVLASLLLFTSPVRCFGYLMPVFDHEHITWTSAGPVGIGDQGSFVSEGKTNFVTYVYLGYHVQFSLPGTAATWLWLGPVVLFTALVGFAITTRTLIRWRMARRAAHLSHAHNAA